MPTIDLVFFLAALCFVSDDLSPELSLIPELCARRAESEG